MNFKNLDYFKNTSSFVFSLININNAKKIKKLDIFALIFPKNKSKKNCISLIRQLYLGNLNIVSSDPALISKFTKIFIVCGPAHIHIPILEKIAPYVEKDSFVGTIFGQGGFDMMANFVFGEKMKTLNLTLFGLQNVPSICKIGEYGQRINVIGPKKFL